MTHMRRISHLLGLVSAVSLIAAACAPAPTTVPPTSPPTTVPATVTAVPPTVVPTPKIDAVGTDINQTLPAGDAARGEQLVTSNITYFSCNFCHVQVVINGMIQDKGAGPSWVPDQENGDQSIVTRAETRYLGEDYTGNATSAQQYLIESILLPDAYIVKYIGYEFKPGRSWMPDDYGQRLTAQDLADIVAYLETIE